MYSLIIDFVRQLQEYSFKLRYLATGDCISSTSYSYLVGYTASDIIKETCQVIWEILKKEVMLSKYTKDEWLKIAKKFEEQWNFPLCVSAIDGKHIAIQVGIFRKLFLILLI